VDLITSSDGKDTMKGLLTNPQLVLISRVFVGLLFIVSSLDKIVDPAAFAQSVSNYGMLPTWMPMIVATILPWLELLCGLGVLFGLLLRGSSLLLSAMLAVFTFAVLTALLRGLDISCGCFTQDPSAEHIGWMKIVQDMTLFALTLFLYFSETTKFTIIEYLQKTSPR
jgi:uncharacterized membrane protein YphA (DoxX/SURF4 family)